MICVNFNMTFIDIMIAFFEDNIQKQIRLLSIFADGGIYYKMVKLNFKNKTAKGKSTQNQYIFGSEAHIFDKKEIVQKQNKLKKLFQNGKNNQIYDKYQKIKFQYTIFSLGQYIEIYSLNPNQTYIAKITQIVQPKGIPDPKAFIGIQWVLRKNDLPDFIIDKYGQFISAAQVFPSTEKHYLYVESIKNKCIVITAQEYGQLGLTSQNIYYTRSEYDNNIKQIVPSPQLWESDCECKKPTNPDLIYVQCSKCIKWFHERCVMSKIINGIFMCDKCFSQNLSIQHINQI